jgi:hypothetical protein
MPTVQLFLQYEGHRRVELIQLDENATVADVLEAARRAGLPDDRKEGACVFGHDADAPFDPAVTLKAAGVRDKHRVHVHRCKKVEVTLHFNERTETLAFPPAATVDKVKKEFVKAIRMSPVDATEHVLQLCGSTDRPDPDTHIGSLVCGCCSLCFDLVPIKRIEG